MLLLVSLLACGRSELQLTLEAPAADGGEVGSLDASVEPPSPRQPRQPLRCPTPESPVMLPEGCAEAMCECNPEAFSSCDWNCWTKVACRVATCFNNPTRIECAEGCADSSEAELGLGRCYQNSRACTRR